MQGSRLLILLLLAVLQLFLLNSKCLSYPLNDSSEIQSNDLSHLFTSLAVPAASAVCDPNASFVANSPNPNAVVAPLSVNVTVERNKPLNLDLTALLKINIFSQYAIDIVFVMDLNSLTNTAIQSLSSYDSVLFLNNSLLLLGFNNPKYAFFTFKHSQTGGNFSNLDLDLSKDEKTLTSQLALAKGTTTASPLSQFMSKSAEVMKKVSWNQGSFHLMVILTSTAWDRSKNADLVAASKEFSVATIVVTTTDANLVQSGQVLANSLPNSTHISMQLPSWGNITWSNGLTSGSANSAIYRVYSTAYLASPATSQDLFEFPLPITQTSFNSSPIQLTIPFKFKWPEKNQPSGLSNSFRVSVMGWSTIAVNVTYRLPPESSSSNGVKISIPTTLTIASSNPHSYLLVFCLEEDTDAGGIYPIAGGDVALRAGQCMPASEAKLDVRVLYKPYIAYNETIKYRLYDGCVKSENVYSLSFQTGAIISFFTADHTFLQIYPGITLDNAIPFNFKNVPAVGENLPNRKFDVIFQEIPKPSTQGNFYDKNKNLIYGHAKSVTSWGLSTDDYYFVPNFPKPLVQTVTVGLYYLRDVNNPLAKSNNAFVYVQNGTPSFIEPSLSIVSNSVEASPDQVVEFHVTISDSSNQCVSLLVNQSDLIGGNMLSYGTTNFLTSSLKPFKLAEVTMPTTGYQSTLAIKWTAKGTANQVFNVKLQAKRCTSNFLSKEVPVFLKLVIGQTAVEKPIALPVLDQTVEQFNTLDIRLIGTNDGYPSKKNSLSFWVSQLPAHGSLYLENQNGIAAFQLAPGQAQSNPDGTYLVVKYEPYLNFGSEFVLTDGFTFAVYNDFLFSDPQSVNITITQVSKVPESSNVNVYMIVGESTLTNLTYETFGRPNPYLQVSNRNINEATSIRYFFIQSPTVLYPLTSANIELGAASMITLQILVPANIFQDPYSAHDNELVDSFQFSVCTDQCSAIYTLNIYVSQLEVQHPPIASDLQLSIQRMQVLEIALQGSVASGQPQTALGTMVTNWTPSNIGKFYYDRELTLPIDTSKSTSLLTNNVLYYKSDVLQSPEVVNAASFLYVAQKLNDNLISSSAVVSIKVLPYGTPPKTSLKEVTGIQERSLGIVLDHPQYLTFELPTAQYSIQLTSLTNFPFTLFSCMGTSATCTAIEAASLPLDLPTYNYNSDLTSEFSPTTTLLYEPPIMHWGQMFDKLTYDLLDKSNGTRSSQELNIHIVHVGRNPVVTTDLLLLSNYQWNVFKENESLLMKFVSRDDDTLPKLLKISFQLRQTLVYTSWTINKCIDANCVADLPVATDIDFINPLFHLKLDPTLVVDSDCPDEGTLYRAHGMALANCYAEFHYKFVPKQYAYGPMMVQFDVFGLDDINLQSNNLFIGIGVLAVNNPPTIWVPPPITSISSSKQTPIFDNDSQSPTYQKPVILDDPDALIECDEQLTLSFGEGIDGEFILPNMGLLLCIDKDDGEASKVCTGTIEKLNSMLAGLSIKLNTGDVASVHFLIDDLGCYGEGENLKAEAVVEVTFVTEEKSKLPLAPIIAGASVGTFLLIAGAGYLLRNTFSPPSDSYFSAGSEDLASAPENPLFKKSTLEHESVVYKQASL